MIDIRLMEEGDYAAYSALLADSSSAVFTQSVEYLNYLHNILVDCQPMHLVAVDPDGVVCGALPLMARSSTAGRVLNSLPYYGSHGSLIIGSERGSVTRLELLDALDQLVSQKATLACTLIGSPLSSGCDRLWDRTDFEDERICQMTSLPLADSLEDAREAVYSIIHGKTRNQVRKGLSRGYRIWHSNEDWALGELHRLHAENMNAIGGLAKTEQSIAAIPFHFQYDCQYRVYCATQSDQVVAALLVFYFKDHVEYFMPAVDQQHRPHQALSALIFTAMVESIVQKRARIWNWGGTWRSQRSLHHFKARWGAKDMPYTYATRLGPRAPDNLGLLSQAFLAEAYPNFYVLPFSELVPLETEGPGPFGEIRDPVS